MKLAKITVLLAMFFSIYLCSLSTDHFYQNQLKFKVVSETDKILSEKDFSGKVTLINFGTLDSEASLKEKILLQEFIDSNSDLDINYIPIMVGKKDQINSFIKENSFSYEFYKDPKNTLTDALKVAIVPSSYILNKDGFLVYKHMGILDFSNLHHILEALNKNSKEVFSGE